MESLLVPFGKFAPFLTDPLVLVGFGLLLVFSIHRVLITSKLIPPLSQRSGTKIVRLLLHYGFILALALIVLGSVLRYGDMREKDENRTVGVDGVGAAVAGNTEPVAKAPVEASAGGMSPSVAQASSTSQTGAVTFGGGAIVTSNAGPRGTSVGVNTGTITSTNIYTVTPDERQALAQRLGVSVTTLEGLLKNMEQAQIPTNRRDEKLRELTEQYKTLERQVAEVRPQDAKVEELKASARKALEEGELSRAKDILLQARTENRTPLASVAETDEHNSVAWDRTRLFAGPTQYPPEDFAAFGIVAFPFEQIIEDTTRFVNVCVAYVETSLWSRGVPPKAQMVTVWPVTTDTRAAHFRYWIGREGTEKLCFDALSSYDIFSTQKIIREARRAGADLRGTGPYLLAWAPGEKKGAQDAPLLLADLSDIESHKMEEVFLAWAEDIEQKPDLWRQGWQVERVNEVIRVWDNRFGLGILTLVNGEP